MSKRRLGLSKQTNQTFFPLPAQDHQLKSEEIDNFIDAFIDLIIDDFIKKYHSGQLDIFKLKKGGDMNN